MVGYLLFISRISGKRALHRGPVEAISITRVGHEWSSVLDADWTKLYVCPSLTPGQVTYWQKLCNVQQLTIMLGTRIIPSGGLHLGLVCHRYKLYVIVVHPCNVEKEKIKILRSGNYGIWLGRCWSGIKGVQLKWVRNSWNVGNTLSFILFCTNFLSGVHDRYP